MTLFFKYEPYSPSISSISNGCDPDKEIPCYRIYSENKDDVPVAETNENLPGEVQLQYVHLFTASEDLREALKYFLGIMHDYESSLAKGYVNKALEKARQALTQSRGGST